MGLKDASFDTIIFLHDDLIIETKNWGNKILNHFNNSDYGILGVAGTTHLTKKGVWWDKQEMGVGVVNHKIGDKPRYTDYFSSNFPNKIIQVSALDGVFFAIKKSRIKYNFDTNIKGFHFYDIDFTFGNNIGGVKVGVIFDVRITHFSIGNLNQIWENARSEFVKKWDKYLPNKIHSQIFYNDKVVNIKKEPFLSIIIPHIHNNSLLFNCINSIKKTSYDNYEIIIADTGSSEVEKQAIREYVKIADNIKLIEYDYYNFAKINNDVVKNHLSNESELLLFSNNDIEMINDMISIMVKFYIKHKNKVGTLGPRLYFENKTIQHSGIIGVMNKHGYIDVGHKGLGSEYTYNVEPTKMLGNTGAFLMINKGLFEKVGLFNENYIECFEDVELNVRCLMTGKNNFNLPEAVGWHYESSTRNKDRENKNARMMLDLNNRLHPFLYNNYNVIKKYIK